MAKFIVCSLHVLVNVCSEASMSEKPRPHSLLPRIRNAAPLGKRWHLYFSDTLQNRTCSLPIFVASLLIWHFRNEQAIVVLFHSLSLNPLCLCLLCMPLSIVPDFHLLALVMFSVCLASRSFCLLSVEQPFVLSSNYVLLRFPPYSNTPLVPSPALNFLISSRF